MNISVLHWTYLKWNSVNIWAWQRNIYIYVSREKETVNRVTHTHKQQKKKQKYHSILFVLISFWWNVKFQRFEVFQFVKNKFVHKRIHRVTFVWCMVKSKPKLENKSNTLIQQKINANHCCVTFKWFSTFYG